MLCAVCSSDTLLSLLLLLIVCSVAVAAAAAEDDDTDAWCDVDCLHLCSFTLVYFEI